MLMPPMFQLKQVKRFFLEKVGAGALAEKAVGMLGGDRGMVVEVSGESGEMPRSLHV